MQMGMPPMDDSVINRDLLRKSEEKYRLFFDLAPEYCYMISPEGTIGEINTSALMRLEYTREELIGKPLVGTIYSSNCQERAAELLKTCRTQGHLEGEEMTIVTKSGEERMLRYYGAIEVKGAGFMELNGKSQLKSTVKFV
jgi:PAS domain S-box-containing protein